MMCCNQSSVASWWLKDASSSGPPERLKAGKGPLVTGGEPNVFSTRGREAGTKWSVNTPWLLLKGQVEVLLMFPTPRLALRDAGENCLPAQEPPTGCCVLVFALLRVPKLSKRQCPEQRDGLCLEKKITVRHVGVPPTCSPGEREGANVLTILKGK